MGYRTRDRRVIVDLAEEKHLNNPGPFQTSLKHMNASWINALVLNCASQQSLKVKGRSGFKGAAVSHASRSHVREKLTCNR